jgi:hypothetical protein
MGFSKNVWADDTFPKYGLSNCGINLLRGLLNVHARSGLHPRLVPRPGRTIAAGTGGRTLRGEFRYCYRDTESRPRFILVARVNY